MLSLHILPIMNVCVQSNPITSLRCNLAWHNRNRGQEPIPPGSFWPLFYISRRLWFARIGRSIPIFSISFPTLQLTHFDSQEKYKVRFFDWQVPSLVRAELQPLTLQYRLREYVVPWFVAKRKLPFFFLLALSGRCVANISSSTPSVMLPLSLIERETCFICCFREFLFLTAVFTLATKYDELHCSYANY